MILGPARTSPLPAVARSRAGGGVTIALVALAAALPAQALPAKEQPKNRAALVRDLASRDAREVAWAAHFASSRRPVDKALAAPLLETLARWRGDRSRDGRDVCMHLLDALLLLDARVPADAAVPLLDDGTCGAAAFTLLARAPQHNEAVLLATFRRDLAAVGRADPLTPRLRATGGVLAAQRTHGLAPLLAARVRRELQVVVRDEFGGRRVSSWLFPAAPLHAQPAWPPLPRYRFTDAPDLHAGDWSRVQLASADGAVQRQVVAQPDGARVEYSLPDDERARRCEADWLCALVGMPAPLTRLVHRFDAPERFAAVVTHARDQRRDTLRRLHAALLEQRLLTAEQARVLDGPVAVDVVDERPDVAVALPLIPPSR